VVNFRNIITSIVTQHGESIDSDFYLDIESGSDSIMDLCIERHGNELIICQYYLQRGDLMRDPQIRLRVEPDGKWTPFSYRIDPLNAYEYSSEGLDIDDVLETWAQNLQSQGFLDN
jgi:hypothetical protein